MNQFIDELINVLDRETKIYEDILKISKDKTRIIVEGKVSELEKIVELEQTLVLQLAKMENSREALVDKISKIIGIKPEEVTITNLVSYSNGEQGETLRIQQLNMKKALNELGNLNDLNARLIKNSLDYINFSINLFANVENQDNNYELSGEKSNVKTKNFFDIKV